MYHHMTIAGVERDLKLFPVNENLQIAAFILFGDVEMTVAAAKALLAKAPAFDIIMTAEAKSISLAYEMARQAGQNDYVVARKGTKVYMENVISEAVHSITTAHEQRLYLGQNEIDKLVGKRVLILDDVISTGETLKCMERLVACAGGCPVGSAAVLAEGEAADRTDIIFLEKLPLFDAQGNPLS